MTWEYKEEYNKLLEILDSHKRPWRPFSLIPKDGTKVYFKCGVDYKGDTLYDVGAFERPWYYPEGEYNTEFGNCDQIIGWKFVEEK